MRRIITIILIVLVILFAFLGISWLVSRKTAEKNGMTPPTFRQFLGIGGSITPGSTNNPGSGLISLFTPDQSTSSGNTGSTPPPAPQPGVRISQFTNGTVTPLGGQSGSGATGVGTGNGGGPTAGGSDEIGPVTPGSGGTGGGSGGGATNPGTGTTAPLCSDADLNITFTAEELARLQTLQNRFYAVAQTLRTDADVATELANHDAFRAKADQINELYLYCQAKTPLLANAVYKKHVPTPFWHDPSMDSPGFITGPGDVQGTVNVDGTVGGNIGGFLTFINDPDFGKRVLEHVLHVNLW